MTARPPSSRRLTKRRRPAPLEPGARSGMLTLAELSSPAGRPLGCSLGRSGARNSRPARCSRPADAFRTRHMVKLRRPAAVHARDRPRKPTATDGQSSSSMARPGGRSTPCAPLGPLRPSINAAAAEPSPAHHWRCEALQRCCRGWWSCSRRDLGLGSTLWLSGLAARAPGPSQSSRGPALRWPPPAAV